MKSKHQSFWFLLTCLAGLIGVNLVAPAILSVDVLPSGFGYLVIKNLVYAALVGSLAAWLLRSFRPLQVLMWIGMGSFVLPSLLSLGILLLFTETLSHGSARSIGELLVESVAYSVFAAIWWLLLRKFAFRSHGSLTATQ